MAESSKMGTAGGKGDQGVDWASLAPRGVDWVRVMSKLKVDKKWEEIYAAAGLRNPSESTRASLRLGVYVYLFRNGATRVGEYSGLITMSDGHSFPASVIVRAVGPVDMRRFMRGNVIESYRALKESRVIENSAEDVAAVAPFGIRAEDAFATADWFDQCSMLTPSEKAAHDKVFNYKLERSSRSRGNKTLESVEEDGLEDKLRAQEVGAHGVREAVF